MAENKATEVIVIGAGIAGLYTAYLLINEGYKVSVLEAGSTYGGRIKSLTGFAQTPIELGAEFIQGKKSLLYDLAEYFDEEIVTIKGKNFVWWQGKLLSEFEAAKNDAVAKAFDFMENAWQYRDEEISVEDFLAKQPYYEPTKDILAVFGMEYGTSNEKIGLKSLAKNDALWQAGSRNYKLKVPMLNLLREFIECIGKNLHFNHTVKNIDSTNDEFVSIELENGKKFKSQYIVCTVPLSILKKKYITFTPNLPKEKITAIDTLGIDSGIKVFLKFKRKFWHETLWELYGTSFCPLYYQMFPGSNSDDHILVGYFMGKFAESFRNKSNLAVKELVIELDSIFGNKVASENLIDSFVMDWKKEKFIEGAYSFDSLKSEGMREILAKPIGKRIFFGGEATNFNGHAATLHGAMETAERCSQEIKNTLNPSI